MYSSETMTIYNFIILTFAVWRLARLITTDEGPFRIFIYLRKAMFKLQLGSLIECIHCTIIWCSLIAILFYPVSIETLISCLAISGGASFLELAVVNNERYVEEIEF